MEVAEVGGTQDAADLAALLEENAALRAENEQLLMETAQYGLMTELPAAPTSPQSAMAVGSRLHAMEQQREALLGVRRLGDALQELSVKTAKLKAEADKLREENLRLNQHNAALRAASRATTPALSTVAADGKQAPPVVRPFREGDLVSGTFVLPPGLDQRAQKISTAIKLGDQDALNTCSEEQRKELVAAMLKVGLFDAVLPASMVANTPPLEAALELPPAVSKAVREPVGSAPRKAAEGGANKCPPAAARPVAPEPAPAPAAAPALAAAAPAALPAPAAAALAAAPALAPVPAPELGLQPGAAPPQAAEPQRQAPAPVASAPVPGRPAPAVAPAAPQAALAEAKAANLASRLASPATGGSGGLESQAQEIAEMLKTCDDSERKELVAEMLRKGLFGAGPPSTLASVPRGDAKAANGKEPSSPPRTVADEVPGLREELGEHARERVVREKLQELNTKARA